MDRTKDLQDIFDALHAARHQALATTAVGEPQAALSTSQNVTDRKDKAAAAAQGKKRAPPSTSPATVFLTALASMTSGCRKLQRETDKVVQSALTTMDEVLIGSADDLDAHIKEAISSGVALSATIADFLASVDVATKLEHDVAAKLREREQRDNADKATENGGGSSSSFLGSVQRLARQTEQWVLKQSESGRAAARTSAGPTERCADVLAHCRVAGEVLQAAVVEEKLRLALCEEEVELFKKDMFILGRCGVLSGATDDVAEPILPPSTHSRAPRKSSSAVSQAVKTGAAALLKTATDNGAIGFRQVVHSLRSTAAGASASSSRTQEQPARPRERRRILRVTEDESKELQHEAVLLEQQLTETSAKAAREVESSIRELSHLTNLLNEQALIQSEQLSLVAKNTEATLSNVAKASDELQKPSRQSSWMLNPTRQLIVFLWACMLFLLGAHMMIR